MSTVTERDTGLICAFALDGKGGGKPLDWPAVRAWKPEHGPLWVHLDYMREDAIEYLEDLDAIDDVTVSALLVDEPRPRIVSSDAGMLLIVRGINLNEGAEPEDMVSMRIWVDAHRVITLRHRRNNAAKDARKRIVSGRGPKRIGAFVVMIVDCILDPIGHVSNELEDAIGNLEDQVLASENYELRHQLADLRRRSIALKRHVAPERDVISRLQTAQAPWLTDTDRAQLGEEANRMTRILEDLDTARDRAAVTQEEVASRLSKLTNKRLYVLSIIAAIFLPMSFVTGLWGINTGGIPLSGHSDGFLLLSAALVLMLGFQLLIFRWMKWM